MALEWIGMIDTMYWDPTKLTESERVKLENRYYLAVFYFSMTLGDNRWGTCRMPETGEDLACVHHAHESIGVNGMLCLDNQTYFKAFLITVLTPH